MEDLYIGEDIPKQEDDLFLGEESEYQIEVSQKDGFSQDDWSVPLPIEEVYRLLVENRPLAYQKDIKMYYQTTTDIFRVVGIDYFSIPTEKDKIRFSNWCKEWNLQAEKKWLRIDPDKCSDLSSALKNLENFFENYEKYYGELENNVLKKLEGSLDEKCADGILEISEIKDILLSAKKLHLWSDKKIERKNFVLEYIKDHCEKENCIVESYEKTFSRSVLQKEKLEKLDVPDTYDALCAEYKELKELDSKIYDKLFKIDDAEILGEVKAVLKSHNIELVDNYLYFKESFFLRVTKQYDLSYPIYSKTYDLLEHEAKVTYKFTDKQWQNLLVETKLKKEGDVSAAFIMGTKSASSLPNIATMLRSDETLAL